MFHFLMRFIYSIPLGRVVARSFSALCVGMALLAIANFDGMLNLSIDAPQGAMITRLERKVPQALLKRPPTPSEELEVKKVDNPKLATTELQSALVQDEILNQNPFNNLISDQPIEEILAKKIARFNRTTYRSSKFKAEFGYDVLHYEIYHPNRTHSSILAYVENGFQVVRLDVATGLEYSSYLFKDGALIEQSISSHEAVQKRIGDQLRTAIAFLSVSR